MKILKPILLLTFLLLASKAHIVKAQPPPCDTCTYQHESWTGADKDILVLKYDTIQSATYKGCDELDTNRKPGLAYIHGLGGDIGSWNKQVTWTDTLYKAACFGVDYGSSNYEVSFHTVATEIKNDLYTGFTSGINTTYPGRCKLNDYVIAHSQGGVAARYLDRQWDVSTSGAFGKRLFRGLVTFGTPNGGAHVAYTKKDHRDFVQSTARVVYLDPSLKGAYNLTSKFGFILGLSIYDITDGIDTLLKKKLAPLMLSSQHTNTMNEMRPDHKTLLSLKNHNTRLHRVAFYGIEDAPECWRVIDNIVQKPSTDYDMWGAQPDTSLVNIVHKIHAHHTGEILNNKKRIKRLTVAKYGTVVIIGASMVNPVTFAIFGSGGVAGVNLIDKKQDELIAQNKHRQGAIDFLNNANTQWRYIIGSYHRDSVSYDTTVYYELTWREKYGWLGSWYWQKREFSSSAGAKEFYNKVDVYRKRDMAITSKIRVETRKEFFPSDGIVLAKSQKAFPGISEKHTDLMRHNNHMQERNSSETHRVLKKLYRGDYDMFFKIE